MALPFVGAVLMVRLLAVVLRIVGVVGDLVVREVGGRMRMGRGRRRTRRRR